MALADARLMTRGTGTAGDRYKSVASANTTAAVFMSVLDGSIVRIALQAIVRAGDLTAPARLAPRPGLTPNPHRHGHLDAIAAAATTAAALAPVGRVHRFSIIDSINLRDSATGRACPLIKSYLTWKSDTPTGSSTTCPRPAASV